MTADAQRSGCGNHPMPSEVTQRIDPLTIDATATEITDT